MLLSHQYGTLHLIPATLGDIKVEKVIPSFVIEIINSIENYIVENERSARRYLIKLGIKKPIEKISFYLLNEHINSRVFNDFIKLLLEGKDVGLITEAGCPAIADPGAEIVRLAHQYNIKVVPLVGPSSIFLALMASGFNGQNFAFSGYLPKTQRDRIRKIKELEEKIYHDNQTQIFMETPYRNNHLLQNIISVCLPQTKLCIASDLTLPTEFIKTKKISEWKSNLPDLNKRLAIFLMYK